MSDGTGVQKEKGISAAVVVPIPDLFTGTMNELEGGSNDSLTFMLQQTVDSKRDSANPLLRYAMASHPIALPVVSTSRMLHVSCLFELDDDSFHNLLSWLDLVCICMLDIAIGYTDERLLWLRSLHTIDTKAIDEYYHSHSSIRWLIMRGARATRIRISGSTFERDRITNETFEGVGIQSTQNADKDDSNYIVNPRLLHPLKSHSTVRNRLRNRDITTDANKGAPVKPRGCHGLTSIDLGCCRRISDIGVSQSRRLIDVK